MKEKLKVNFGSFWHDFDAEHNMFTRKLADRYDIELSDKPDFYFFTHPYNGKRDYLKYNCHRVFLGWENARADWNICDYVLDSDFYSNNPRHKRYPIWASWDINKLCIPKNINAFNKKKFCCMVISNTAAKERIDFFNILSKYKKVDSGGRFLNNIGGPVDNKLEFIKDYKFVISFENSSFAGYTTEKLVEPMLSNSVPIYWGNPSVAKDFNTKSFINVNDFNSYEDAVNYIIRLDNDENAFAGVINQPWFNNNKIPDEFTEESFLNFFDFVIKDSKTKKPVASSVFKDYMHKFKILKTDVQFALLKRLKYN